MENSFITVADLKKREVSSVPENKKHNTLSIILTFKNILALLLIVLLMDSNIFKRFLLSPFKGAVKNDELTFVGTLIKSIFLIIFYILALFLIDRGYI